MDVVSVDFGCKVSIKDQSSNFDSDSVEISASSIGSGSLSTPMSGLQFTEPLSHYDLYSLPKRRRTV